jgi:prevent-host-death family protein
MKMKKQKTFNYPPVGAKPFALREVAMEEPELVVNVRAAKDQLSSLLEAAARGDEVVITSDGQPKAKLVPVHPRRQPFRVDWALLRSMPVPKAGSTAEEWVRTERDSRP